MPSVVAQKAKASTKKTVLGTTVGSGGGTQSTDADNNGADGECMICSQRLAGEGALTARGDALRLTCRGKHVYYVHEKCWEKRKAQHQRALAGSRRVRSQVILFSWGGRRARRADRTKRGDERPATARRIAAEGNGEDGGCCRADDASRDTRARVRPLINCGGVAW